ncbi:MAG: DUF4175 family protein [Sediminibacterium sp.]|nr:DUF4175 family protein [Sediminibacterium sp.]
MAQETSILIEKLEEFIRKYYKNQLIKGVLYASGLLLSAFLTVVVFEYFGEFNTTVRTILFYTFLGITLLVLARYIAIPLLKLNKLGKRLTYTDAATLIGNHFSTIQDKLINVLQLQGNNAISGSTDLMLASIEQKITELKPIPFTNAVNLAENKRYLKYLAPLFFITLAILLIWPQVITRSTQRLVQHSTHFAPLAPFQFIIENPALSAIQSQDYELKLKLKGTEIPNEVYISVNGVEYKMEKENTLAFSYTFKNVQGNQPFQFNAAGFNSAPYELKVLPRPVLQQFDLQLIYPAYLQKQNEKLVNSGDLQIPQGTKVIWTFRTRNTDAVYLRFNDSLALPSRQDENSYTYTRRFMSDNAYVFKASNHLVQNTPDSVNYSIQVIPDQFPAIEAEANPDTTNTKHIYFSGSIKDDYGFSSLQFHFKKTVTDSLGKPKEENGSFPISIQKTQVLQPFYYYLDISTYNLGPGDKLEYYFEVADNDGVNGSKRARTQMMAFKAPTREDVEKTTDRNNAEIKKDLEESIKKAKSLQKDVSELSKKINDKKQLGYEEKKKIEELLQKQQSLQNKVEEIKQENAQNTQQQNEFNQMDEALLEKQQELQKLFENVMTPEMKKLFDELNKMLEQMDKNQIQQKLEEVKLNNKDLEKELDRNLELFKQLEVEQKMQSVTEKLDELSKKQNELSKESEQKNSDAKNIESKQEELNKAFDDLKKEMEDLTKKNSELEEPNALPNMENKANEVSKEQQKASEQLSKNSKKDAAKSQKDAAKKMEEMKEQMDQAMAEAEEEKDGENAAALRQILENLLNLSFAQEELIKTLPKTRVDNPQYVKIPQDQRKLQDDSKLIEDSLLALSKRAPQVSSIINKEISAIHLNMEKTVKALADRNTSDAGIRMQSSMTAINNLAVLLNESLEQMQKQMQQKKNSKSKGGSKCKKPGNGKSDKPSDKPSLPNMRQLQEQLNQQLKELKDALEKGKKPGEKPGEKPGQKPGQKPGGNQGNGMVPGLNMPGSSEQLAKLAAQQEALRRQMQQMMDKLKNKGKNPGGQIADMMEQTEKDIVNRQITQETMRRQQEILTKLLESEKAEREREQDEQRKSNEAKNEILSNPKGFLEYKRLKEKELELLNTVPPHLTPFYKEKVNNYFNSVNNK